MNVETFVMPHECASSMRSICVFAMVGKFAMSFGSSFAGAAGALQAAAAFVSCCSIVRICVK